MVAQVGVAGSTADRQLHHPGGASGHGRSSEDRRQSHRGRAIRGDARHPGRRQMAGRPGATGPPGQAPNHRPAATSRPDPRASMSWRSGLPNEKPARVVRQNSFVRLGRDASPRRSGRPGGTPLQCRLAIAFKGPCEVLRFSHDVGTFLQDDGCTIQSRNPAEQLLLKAVALSLAIHLAAFGGWTWGRKPRLVEAAGLARLAAAHAA